VAHVPYAGGAPAVTDLIAGTVQMSLQNLGTISAHIQEGRVKPILITADRRSLLLPQIPTTAEARLRDFVVCSWQALGRPAAAPLPLLQRIHREDVAALHSPENEEAPGRDGLRGGGWGAMRPPASPGQPMYS